MESLALLVTLLILFALLAGPIAIGLTRFNSNSWVLNVIRKIFHGFFVALSFWVGMMFSFNSALPFLVRIIGIYGLSMGYIALRREYFPDVRFIAPLLAKFGVKIGKDRINNGASKSLHGPRMKWHRGGNSGGNDGHGPEGQH